MGVSNIHSFSSQHSLTGLPTSLATPGRVLAVQTRGFQHQAELPRGVRGTHQQQINMEMYASYVYLSMASYFSRDDQALHGSAKFFRKSSDEERSHAIMFMDYQNKRG